MATKTIQEDKKRVICFNNHIKEISPLDKIYTCLDNEFRSEWLTEFKNLVNFSTRQYFPIHRWFFYREAYSPSLVERIIESAGLSQQINRIIDPFCGGGTTLLVSAQRGISSFGFEVNPFSLFASKVKTRNYSANDIHNLEVIFEKIKLSKPLPSSLPLPKLSFLDRLFDSNVLESLMGYKQCILQIEEPKYRDFFFFGWLSILESVSNYRKSGNGLKRKNRTILDKDISEKLLFRLETMIGDLKYLQRTNKYKTFVEPRISGKSALNISAELKNQHFDISIFSPPYLNCFDYCEVYKIELWMGDFVSDYEDLRKLRKLAISSHLNGDLKNNNKLAPIEEVAIFANFLREQELWDKRIPQMVEGYFADMEIVLKGLKDILEPNSLCVIVVSNSAYANRVIPTDLFLAKIGEKVGFNCELIGIARKNETSSQQHKNLKDSEKFLRESLVFLRRR